MEYEPINEPVVQTSPLVTKWKKLTIFKKTAITGVSLLVVYIIFTIVVNLLTTTTGLQGNGLASYAPSVPQSGNRASESIAEYDSATVAGVDAEDFETRDYNASIKTDKLAQTCATIENLKPLPHVIFNFANESKTSCTYRFKVANDQAESVLTTIKELDPETLNQNIHTIKKQIENKLSQRDILERNLISTEQVLNEALVSYDNLLTVATVERNASALATSIKNKIALIDQLKQRREQTRQQIDQLNRQLADQQDRLDYTYFSVSIYEWKYFSHESIKNSWQQEIKQLVNSANDVLQKLTLGLLSFMLYVALFAVYIIIALVIIRLGWRIVKAIWKT